MQHFMQGQVGSKEWFFGGLVVYLVVYLNLNSGGEHTHTKKTKKQTNPKLKHQAFEMQLFPHYLLALTADFQKTCRKSGVFYLDFFSCSDEWLRHDSVDFPPLFNTGIVCGHMS